MPNEMRRMRCLILHPCLIWHYCILAPHPSTALTPSPEGEGFLSKISTHPTVGANCVRPILRNTHYKKQRRTQFAPTVVLFIHIKKYNPFIRLNKPNTNRLCGFNLDRTLVDEKRTDAGDKLGNPKSMPDTGRAENTA